MKAKQHSFKRNPIYTLFLFITIICGLTQVNAQCPTVTNNSQSFCDLQSVLVGDLQASDNGGGIVWYESAVSTVPLSNSDGLVNGEDYYADDNTGTCGSRARVDVTIYGPPIGNNFQGVCVSGSNVATVSDLIAAGNDVQWYLTPSGGLSLNNSDILIDNTIYYADQASPDGSCRTSRLSVFVNVGVTSFPTGDMVQSFCGSSTTNPTVGDLVASGTNNWYISLFSALPLPAATPLVNGQTYYATTVDPPCESSGRLAVLVILEVGPDSGSDGILDICSNNTGSTFNLFNSLGGSPEAGGTWTPVLNSGTGIYDPNIDPQGEFTYTVTSTNTCPDTSSTVTVSIIPEPNAGTDGIIDLCSNSTTVDLFSSLGGTPEVGGTWSPALTSGTGIFDPAIDSGGIYTYTVNGTSPCNNATAIVNVSVTSFQDAGENGTIDICDNIGTINLFDSLGGTPDSGGIWSPALNSGTGIFDPSADTAGVYTYSFTGNAPCPDQSATVAVTVTPLPIAGTDATLEICSNDLATVNLFNSLGGSPEIGGTWSPALTSGTGIFDPAVDAAGIYTYLLTGTPPCTDVSAEVNVIIIQEPDAGMNATIDLCSNNGTIDLFDSLEGTPEVGGTWTPVLNSGSNIFDPLIDAIGTYTYTVAGTSPCADATATVSISVIPFQNAGTDGSVTVCNNDSPIDLFNSLGGTPETGGTWTPTLTSTTGIFDPSVDTAGTYTYTTSGTGPCLDDTATVEVTIELAPDAGIDATLNLCSNDGTINLFDNLAGTPDAGGFWTPALNSGTNIFDPLVDAVGTYTYTVTGTSPCIDASATITISISPFQNAGTDGSVTVCTADGTIDLFDNLGGTPDIGGTWTPTLNSNTGIFDPTIDTAGTYTYTTSSTGSCNVDSATVEVSVEISPDAGTDGTLDLCDLTSSVDLINSLNGTPQAGGTWSPALVSGTGIFDPNSDIEGVYTYTINSLICGNSSATVTVSVIDANDAGNNGTVELCFNDSAIDLFNSLGGTPDAGGIWSPTLTSGTGVFDPALDLSNTYTYTISNSATLCPDDSATVTVTVLQAPNAGNDGTLNLCNSTNTANLFDSLSGTPEPGGTWSPALTSGTGIFDPNTDPEGIYTYTVNNSCSNSSATVTVSLSNTNDAGTNGTIELCNTDSTVDLFNSLGGTPDVGGIWTPSLISGNGIFDPSIDTAGIYTYTVSNASSTCPDATSTVTVSILQGPNAGNDGTLNLCNSTNTIDLFDSLAGTPETGGSWSPALTSGTGVFNPNTDPEGIYTYSLNNSCGTSSATVTVSLSDVNDAGTDSTIELCNTDAAVNLFNSLGGTPDIGGTWSPTLTSGTGVFDPMIDTAAIYTYTVSNTATPCPDVSATVTVSVLEGPNAGNDGTLNLCDSTNTVNLFDSLAGTPETGGTWSPALTSGTGIFDPNTDPEGTYTYTLNNSCGMSSATVTVSLSDVNDAGTDGTIELCNTDGTVDLFNSLGGMPDVGGIWSPALTSGTGIFDPSTDTATTYTYTVSSSGSSCPDASATVIVSVFQAANAGVDGTLNLCNSTTSIDLFDSLGGTPDIGGNWSPILTSGTGIFDPTADSAGIYTYTLNNTCGNSSATVTVSLSNLNDAGTDGAIELCSTDASVNLFNSLGGTPQTGGTWSPALTSGTGIFDPTVDVADTYTYTVSSGAGSTCPDASANVVVTFTQAPNAGNDGTLNLCSNDSNLIDLIDSLGGTPDATGVWSPTLASGTGIFDPTTDSAGSYTYTVTNSCGNNSAEVTVSISSLNDAGTDGTIELCSTDTSVDLFNSLGGTPQTGGTWSPVLTSGTGIFDPMVDAADTYTYTVSSGTASTCPDAMANVVVTFTQGPNAGSDGTLDLCTNDSNLVDLIDSLGNTPDLGGVWSPALASGTGMYDPTSDSDGVYTYTVTNSCGTSSAEVNVSISLPNDAGTDGTIELCSNDASVDLFDSLGGTPQTDGVWVPILTSGTGIFDPTIDAAGIYTYLVADITDACPDATATVEVTILALPDAGIDNTLNLCADETNSVDLFESLDGTPQTGGIWTPALTSGTGEFDPTVDTAGNYTYSVTSIECNLTASANITVTILNLPDVTGLELSMDNNFICLGEDDAVINITDANQLPDGDYSIVYQLTEANVSVNTAAITISGGNATFTIPQTLLPNPGLTMVTLNQLFVLGQTCSAITSSVEPLKIIVQDPQTPELIENGTEFCIEDISTIADLSNNVSNNSEVNDVVVWYNQLEDGVAYDDSDVLQEGVLYYGAIRTEHGCESSIRLEVTISYIECIGNLLIPDGFSPNDDGINDTFDILFLGDLYPNFKVSIYNRYGNILYEGDKNSPQWDGTWKNNDTILPIGVYFYIIEFNDGETEAVQGRVYLSR